VRSFAENDLNVSLYAYVPLQRGKNERENKLAGSHDATTTATAAAARAASSDIDGARACCTPAANRHWTGTGSARDRHGIGTGSARDRHGIGTRRECRPAGSEFQM